MARKTVIDKVEEERARLDAEEAERRRKGKKKVPLTHSTFD